MEAQPTTITNKTEETESNVDLQNAELQITDLNFVEQKIVTEPVYHRKYGTRTSAFEVPLNNFFTF